MSKYQSLWKEIALHTEDQFILTFAKIQQILGFPLDHSFLTDKKELKNYGYEVRKISLNKKVVTFCRMA